MRVLMVFAAAGRRASPGQRSDQQKPMNLLRKLWIKWRHRRFTNQLKRYVASRQDNGNEHGRRRRILLGINNQIRRIK